MKATVLLVLVVVAAASAAVIDVANSDTRIGILNGITIGIIGDSTLIRHFSVSRAAAITPQTFTLRIPMPEGIRVTAFRATEIDSNKAVVRRVAGGLGFDFVTLQFISLPFKGFQFAVQVWGR